ncbi:MFS transporter [Anaerosporomusa subterranea]|uniref:MFS transporter n=1 Tax=Anaerosporomusa subterranea TaxID=1794912 RepID=A0A154BPA0_ANASB|nr:OFA family MFS transporter [Anaerosporomusa subterranea]KYZ75843.1 MFS transporter [Anaerosporomusa subterranea]
MTEKSTNRWLVLLSGILINLCIGSAYAWSVYQKPLIAMFKWSTKETSLAFTLSCVLVPLAMIVAGKIQDQKGPKMVIFGGGIIFGLGIIGAGFTNSLSFLYMTYGVLGGIGIGTVYACTVANTVKFFPDKRGLASGLVVAGFGSGAVVLAPLSSALIESYGVLATFKILGVAYLVLISACTTLVKTAPPGYRPAGWTPPPPTATTITGTDKNWREMLSDPMFYVLWSIYLIGCVSGLMIIGHASPIGQEVIKLSPATAAMCVGFLALANTAGRIFWGWVSDKIGRYNAVKIMFILAGLMMFTLTQVTTFVPFVIVLMAIGLCFGGVMGIFPSITADAFGAKNLGMNYGIIFTAWGAAGIVGPLMAGHFKEINKGDYTQAFLIAAGLSVIGVMLTFILQYNKKKADALKAA